MTTEYLQKGTYQVAPRSTSHRVTDKPQGHGQCDVLLDKRMCTE